MTEFIFGFARRRFLFLQFTNCVIHILRRFCLVVSLSYLMMLMVECSCFRFPEPASYRCSFFRIILFLFLTCPISLFPMRCTCSTHLILLYLIRRSSILICRTVCILELFTTKFSAAPRHFVSFRSKYSPKHLVLRHPQPNSRQM
jgi:hypothetical protein